MTQPTDEQPTGVDIALAETEETVRQDTFPQEANVDTEESAAEALQRIAGTEISHEEYDVAEDPALLKRRMLSPNIAPEHYTAKRIILPRFFGAKKLNTRGKAAVAIAEGIVGIETAAENLHRATTNVARYLVNQQAEIAQDHEAANGLDSKSRAYRGVMREIAVSETEAVDGLKSGIKALEQQNKTLSEAVGFKRSWGIMRDRFGVKARPLYREAEAARKALVKAKRGLNSSRLSFEQKADLVTKAIVLVDRFGDSSHTSKGIDAARATIKPVLQHVEDVAQARSELLTAQAGGKHQELRPRRVAARGLVLQAA